MTVSFFKTPAKASLVAVYLSSLSVMNPVLSLNGSSWAKDLAGKLKDTLANWKPDDLMKYPDLP